MRTRPATRGLALAAAMLLAFVFLRGGLAGREAPNFTLRGVYGGRIDKASFRGRPVLLVFCTTYCGICRHELPIVDRVAEEFRPGVEVVAVNLGDPDGARAFLRDFRITGAVDETGEAARDYHVRGVPKLVFIDAAGKVKYEASGFHGEGQLRRWFERVSAP